jgi:cell division inhibitor SepF
MFDKIREKLSKVAKNEEEEIVFKKLEEDELDLKSGVEHPVYDDEEEEIMPEPTKKNVLEGGNIELKVLRPEAIGEVSTIADHLLRGCTVVLNLELLDRETVTRMLDFLRGVAYTIDGEISHVSKATYIITANGIDISDSI